MQISALLTSARCIVSGMIGDLTCRREGMKHRLVSFLVCLGFVFVVCAALAQDTPLTQDTPPAQHTASTTTATAIVTATATCSFDADTDLTADYQKISFNLKKPVFGREIPYGKAWAPGGKPLTLFANSNLEIGGKILPRGVYTMFVLPTQKQWTLIISKSTDLTGSYDEQQDVVRVAMEPGVLPTPESEFKVSFAHLAPDQCSLRLDLATVGHWVTFQRK